MTRVGLFLKEEFKTIFDFLDSDVSQKVEKSGVICGESVCKDSNISK